jgi:hypothetical protein
MATVIIMASLQTPHLGCCSLSCCERERERERESHINPKPLTLYLCNPHIYGSFVAGVCVRA